MAKYLTTKLHVYQLAKDSAEWRKLHKDLAGRHALHVLEMPRKGEEMAPGVYTVALETGHLFDNQWNTADDAGDAETRGRRVFDWYEAMVPTATGVKYTGRGHWLEITDEMRAILRDTVGCGYCGHQMPAAGAPAFCPRCLDSAYLKPEDLRLLRMRPIDAPFNEPRPELSEEERATLLPLYRSAQLHGSTERGKARRAKQRQDIVERAAKRIESATDERDGMLWLLDHGANVENVIYYSHTGRFSFGWRKPVDATLYGELCELLTEFPFDYDIVKAEVVAA